MLSETEIVFSEHCLFACMVTKMSIQHCARLLLIIYVPPSSMSRRLIVMHCFVRSLTSPVMVHGLVRMSLLRLRNTCNVSSMFTSLQLGLSAYILSASSIFAVLNLIATSRRILRAGPFSLGSPHGHC